MMTINDTEIAGACDLSAYLEENSLPIQAINVTIVGNNQTITIPVTLRAELPTNIQELSVLFR